MLLAFLTEQQTDLLPTLRNVRFLLDLGLRLATQGDPALLAFDSARQAVGFLLWGNPDRALLDQRWQTCPTFGGYVVPSHRHHGVMRALRERARSAAIAAGYERVIGPVALTNWRGVEHFIDEYGAWPTTVQMEQFL